MGTHPQPDSRSGFALLELIIAAAVLAVVAASLLVYYGGLEDKAATAHATFNMAATERAIRIDAARNRSFINDWDSLLTGRAGRTPFRADDLLDRLSDDLAGRLQIVRLRRNEVDALAAVGITIVRDVDTGNAAVNQYDDDDDFSNDNVAVPNRIFDDAVAGSGFYGAARTLERQADIAVVEDASDLGAYLGLAVNDRVVALGLGNNAIVPSQSQATHLRQVPFGQVRPGEYGRFIALFQVREAGRPLAQARFLGVLDPRGRTLDEAAAAWNQ